MASEIKVISLDLDGVLFEGPSAAFVVAQQVGIGDQFRALMQKVAAEEMSPEESVHEVAKIWKGIPADNTYHDIIKSLPLMTGSEETVKSLKDWGYEVGCISSGVSQFFMLPLRKRMNLDFAYSNVLGSKEGAHDGTVEYIMMGPEKAETILKYVKEIGYSLESVASVGNGFNDIDLFKASAFSIAFNPVHQMVSDAASVTVESKDLRSILPYFEKS
ncbi:MAG: HAD hydrolase family protein [Candidatus Thorarchaeota archaeon]